MNNYEENTGHSAPQYGYSHPARPEAADVRQGAAQQNATNGWVPYEQFYRAPAAASWQPSPPPGLPQGFGGRYSYTAPPPQGPARKKGRAGGVAALVLVCALAGFGGGAAYTGIVRPAVPERTLVYQGTSGGTPAPAAVQPGTATISEVAAAAKQSVVAITTESVVGSFMMGEQIAEGAGSGVVISEDGTILTNNHVVADAREVLVTLPDGSEYPADVIGTDAVSDVAVLKIEATGLVPATLGNSGGLEVGDFCLAVGNPTGALEGTVTDGIISALNRTVNIDGYEMNLLQMNAAVSPGNSGGGLFDAAGQLIGIVNAKSNGQSTEGLGFAIPIDTAMRIAEELMEKGYISRPAMGVMVRTVISEADAARAGVETPGVYIEDVNPGGAAEQAGIQPGDRVISADGAEITESSDLSGLIGEKKVGDTIELEIERGGRRHTVTVVLAEARQIMD